MQSTTTLSFYGGSSFPAPAAPEVSSALLDSATAFFASADFPIDLSFPPLVQQQQQQAQQQQASAHVEPPTGAQPTPEDILAMEGSSPVETIPPIMAAMLKHQEEQQQQQPQSAKKSAKVYNLRTRNSKRGRSKEVGEDNGPTDTVSPARALNQGAPAPPLPHAATTTSSSSVAAGTQGSTTTTTGTKKSTRRNTPPRKAKGRSTSAKKARRAATVQEALDPVLAAKVEQGAPLSESEQKELKRQRRLVKNREAAQQFRRRQKEHIQTLETQVEQLSAENERTTARLDRLATENQLMQHQLTFLRSFLSKAVAVAMPSTTAIPSITDVEAAARASVNAGANADNAFA